MAGYHFVRAYQGIHNMMRGCPTVLGHINRDLLKAANKLAEAATKQFIDARNAISHEEETTNSPEAFDSHAIESGAYEGAFGTFGSGGQLMFQSCMDGQHNFIATWDGKSVQIAITEETGKQLEVIRDAYFAAFESSTEAMKAKFLTRLGVTYPRPTGSTGE